MRSTQGKTVCSAAVAAESLVASHSVRHAIYHIVEEPGGRDWMTEVETPPEAYYDLLRIFLINKKFPAADHRLIDHCVSFEVFLDKSIISGFSFGCDKAK